MKWRNKNTNGSKRANITSWIGIVTDWSSIGRRRRGRPRRSWYYPRGMIPPDFFELEIEGGNDYGFKNYDVNLNQTCLEKQPEYK